MKEATDLREAIALTIAEVADHSPAPAPPRLTGGPSGHSCLSLLFPVAMWPPNPSIEQHPQMVMSLYSLLPGPLPVLQTNNELEAQRVATEFAFRKRLREMEKAYSELKWQEKNVSPLRWVPWGLDLPLWDEEPSAHPGSPGCTRVGSTSGQWSLCSLQTLEEISELQEDIQHLEEDLRRKLLNLKLCHTRLESRTYRPNVELCRDQV